MFKTEILNSESLIEDACALLYVAYIERMQWNFSADNPSKIRIEERGGRKLLIDRFTKSAIWFGAFDDEKLVGCVRLLSVDENNQLEIETYPNSQPIHHYIPVNEKDRCYDITKLAIDKKYIGKGIVNRLFLSCFLFCQDNQSNLLACTHNGYLKSLFKKIEFPIKKEEAFKYEPQDTSPVNFYFADYKKSEVKEVAKNLTYLDNDMNSSARNIFKALNTVESILPVPFYWMNTEGVVLGINEICLKAIGTTREIINKNPRDFYKKEIAEHILKHNAEVIRKEEILSQEEWIEDITTREKKCFSSVKAPLYDDEGSIIGIIGTSMEITAQKEAELLKLESERQKAALIEKEKFILIARKFAHDITSPLTTMKILAPTFATLLETQGNIFNNALERLLDASDHLLTTYKNAETAPINDNETKKPIVVFDHIKQIVEEKKVLYNDRAISFDLQADDDTQKIITNLQVGQFRRALSNLLNNAVDAIDKKGRVTVQLQADTTYLILTISDTGNGMPEHIKQKILAGQRVTENKENGNGMGMQQVWDMLNQNGGTMQIRSENNFGTIIQITLSR